MVRLPPLNALRAFEAAARHLSVKHAADELCVTPGAVSQLRERVRLVPVGNRPAAGEEATDAPDIRTTPEDLAHRVDVP